MTNFRNTLLLIIFLGISNYTFAQAIVGQKKQYTGDPISVDKKEDKYYFSMNGKLAGYYTKTPHNTGEGDKPAKINAAKNSEFGTGKYKKTRAVERTDIGFNGSLYSTDGTYLADIDYINLGFNFKFKEPYEIVFIKGIKIQPMLEELIDKGKLN